MSGGWLIWSWHKNTTVVMPSIGGEYSEAIIGNPRTANPLLAANDAELDLSQLTYRGLFKYSKQGKTVTDLAENWDLSSDGKTYQISLRLGLKWSDGEPLTADDIIFTFNRLQNKDLMSPRYNEFRDLSVNRINALTVSFTLKTPYAPFLSALTIGIIPAHIWNNIPIQSWLTNEASLKPVGTGPFRFKTVNKDASGNIKSYSLEPNTFTHTKRPFLKSLTIKFVPDTAAALDYLRQNAVDGLGGIDTASVNSLSSGKFNLYDIPLPQYTAIFFNPEQNDILKNKSVRQALNYATNRLELIQKLSNNNYRPATGPFVVGELKNKTAAVAWPFNLAAAEKLITAAGFKKDNQGKFFVDSQGEPLTIILTIIDQSQYLATAEAIKNQWEKIGIKVELNLIPPSELHSNLINNRAYQAILASEITGLDPDPYPFWHSSQIIAPGLNLAKFQDHEADKLLTEARQTNDDKKRQSLYLKFQEILKDESPAIFLFSKNYMYALSYKLQGLERRLINQPANRFLDIENWYTKIGRE